MTNCKICDQKYLSVDFKVDFDATFACISVQHFNEDFHLATSQSQKVLEAVDVDLLVLGGANFAGLNRALVGKAEQLEDVFDVGDTRF